MPKRTVARVEWIEDEAKRALDVLSGGRPVLAYFCDKCDETLRVEEGDEVGSPRRPSNRTAGRSGSAG